MYRTLLTLAASAGLVGLVGCGSETRGTEVETEASAPSGGGSAATLTSTAPIEGSRVTLHVSGLSCPLCATNVDKQLTRVPGVRTSMTDLSRGRIDVGLASAGRPTPAQLADAVRDSGFTLTRMEIH